MNSKTMSVKGLGCIFNMPIALTSTVINGKEIAQRLPPRKEVNAHVVDEYPACPANWMHGSDKASSYFVGVEEGKGMWLDLNPCNSHEYEVAAIISIQGVNPVTGQKQDKMILEKFGSKCPKHGCDFQQDRFCPECKYKWPAQNYMATTGTPHGSFWLDGFRSEDGKVRQYLITSEKIRSVAASIIGNQRVFAIGVAFFLSKKPKPVQASSPLRSVPWPTSDNMIIGSSDIGWGNKMSHYYDPDDVKITCSLQPYPCSAMGAASAAFDESNDDESDNVTKSASSRGLSDLTYSAESIPVVKSTRFDKPQSILRTAAVTKKLEIGAGALIDQMVYADPNDLDFWQEEPEAFIYINYVEEAECQRILSAGKREEKAEGFLEGIKVGN